MEINRTLLFTLCLITPITTPAEIYRWVDENGNPHFSDRPHPQKHIPIPSQHPLPSQRDIDKPSNIVTLQIRQLLLSKQFDTLSKQLHRYQLDFEQDVEKEDQLIHAYQAFQWKAPELESLLNLWIKQQPGNYQGYLARASYYYLRGWEARGHKFARKTSEQQFTQMREYFAKAKKDIETTHLLDNRALSGYLYLINIGKAESDDQLVDDTLKQALSQFPQSYHIRVSYLISLTPRWGGSYDAMQEFVIHSQQHSNENTRFKLLSGVALLDAANTLSLDEQYQAADKLLNAAVTLGNNAEFLLQRGKNYYRLDQYSQAVDDLNRAVQLNPDDVDIYYWRSKVFAQQQQYSKAVSDAKMAIKLNAYHERYQSHMTWLGDTLTYEGYQQTKSRNYAKAVNLFNQGIRLDPQKADNYYYRAKAQIDSGRFAGVETDLKKAIKLAPDEFTYYLLMDYVLAKKKRWDEIISYWDRYIARNPDHGRAYVERGGTYYHKGDIHSAVKNAKIAADLGNIEGKEAYEKFKHLVK